MSVKLTQELSASTFDPHPLMTSSDNAKIKNQEAHPTKAADENFSIRKGYLFIIALIRDFWNFLTRLFWSIFGKKIKGNCS